MASNPPKDIPADGNSGSTDSKSESSSQDPPHSGLGTATLPGPAFPANSFDFSAMTNLLNDPIFNELAEQMANDPSFDQMAMQLRDSSVNCSFPKFDTQNYFSTMEQAKQNPQFMTMANALVQDPSMSSMLENFSDPTHKDQLEGIMARIKEDSFLKHILEDIEIGGPCAMMKYWNDKDVLQKLGGAMDLPVSGDRATFAENSGAEETEKLGNEVKLTLHNAVMVGDVEGLKTALASGADKDEAYDSGSTALHIACALGEVECAEILLEAGAAVDACDIVTGTALHVAAALGKEQCVALLLKNGASSTLQNSKGKTPIDIAKERSHLKILKLMEEGIFL